MSDSSPWLRSYTKLRFFVRIRRFLQLKNSNKQSTPSDQFRKPTVTYIDGEGNRNVNKERESTEDELVIMQRSVKRLHFGSWQEKVAAAEEIRRLAKEDLKLRKSAAELGIVSPLVAMVGSEVGGRRRVAVQALIELANGSYKNKAMLVESEFLSKLPKDISALDESTRHEMAQLLLSISSLTNSQFPLNSSKLVPFLVGILESNSRIETKNLCIGTLHNLFTILDQVEILVTNEVVHILLSLSSLKETSEKALATLVNLVVTWKGKRAIENNPMVPNSLIEILTWEEKPKSQEFSTYILMILAHQSSTQKEKMVRLGIVPVLLEVALLGSPLAQKRALKLLQWFKDEHRAKFGPHSGPQMGRMGRVGIIGSLMNKRDVDEGRKMMKKLVRESLYKNMEKITRRANYGDDCSSKLKALVLSSSSKSLPY